MDIEINYQKIIKKLKIRLFKCERYFEYFKSFLLSLNLPDDNSTKKSKVYNLIQSKHSIQKKPKLIFWSSIYLMFLKPSIEYPNELNILEEKYLHFYSQYIFKFLCSLSDIYSAEINILKQEYLNLCIKFINQIKNKRIKTVRIRNNSLRHFLYESRNKDKFKSENNDNSKDNEKSSDDDDEDDNEKNNKFRYGDSKRPKTLIEKELFKLKLKSSNEVVDEFIGDINNDLLINKKKEICFLHFIKTKKNKIFRRYLSNQTRKDLDEMNKNDLLYTKQKDKFDSIFTLEMKIKNQNYRNSKKKKEINLKFNNKTTTNNYNNENQNIFKYKNKNISKFALKKNIIMNLSDKNKLIYKVNQNKLPKCFSFKLKTKNKLFLPLLPKEENPYFKTRIFKFMY